MAGAVRTPVGPDARLPKRRTLDERLYVRWPGVYAALARTVLRLPLRSRLRRALLRRFVLSGWAAYARYDLDVVFVRYAPDFPSRGVQRADGGWHTPLHPQPRRVPGVIRRLARGMGGWSSSRKRSWTPEPCSSFLGRVHLRARGSGIEFDSPIGSVVWTGRDGLVARERDFGDWSEALEAVGLSDG
jgi:hypothetical protein